MKVRNVKAGIRLGLIVDAPPENPEVVLATLGCEVIGVRVHHVTRGLVERVRASGRKVFGWGLEDAADVEAVLGLGVDGVVSDFPDVVKGILEGGREGDADACLRGVIGERYALDSSRGLGMTSDITRAAIESI